MRASSHLFADDGEVPNNRLPMPVCAGAVTVPFAGPVWGAEGPMIRLWTRP